MKVQDRFDENRIGDLVCDGAYKYVQNFAVEIDGKRVAEYDSLDAVTKEWKDYEKPKEYWFINSCGAVEIRTEKKQSVVAGMHKMLGNYFETEEEAELAVEKQEAYKRLKDKGLNISLKTKDNIGYLEANWQVLNGDYSDVKICFGEEEE